MQEKDKQLFDQIYAMKLDTDKAQVSDSSNTDLNYLSHLDFSDSLLLLKSQLKAKQNSCPSESFSECENKLNYVEVLLSSTHNKKCNDSIGCPIQQILTDCGTLLDTNILDESTWNGQLPDELLLHGMLGELPVHNCPSNFSFYVRGENYLKDHKKVFSGKLDKTKLNIVIFLF